MSWTYDPLAILVYDYALTLPDEVARYWGTRMTWGTAFFYLNRYSALLGTVPLLAEVLLTTSDPSKAGMCDAFTGYHKYFALLSLVLVAAMLIMRTYALYERNKHVLAFMIVVIVADVAFAVSMLILAGNSRDTLDSQLQALGCPSPTPHESNTRTAAAWGGMLVFDVMIFILTVHKALRYETRTGSLINVLFRDGSMYFGIMIAVNAINIGTYTMGGPVLSGSGTVVVNALSSLLLTRLMLNLRDPKILRLAIRTDLTTQDYPVITTIMEPYLDRDQGTNSIWIENPEEGADSGAYRMQAIGTSDHRLP
ncbi:hypothetical protein B0H12DRAFT_1241152 [Mycena haematopus]|nr:hypothetical protein B0H12DRAFT_1241152 [Mycena haematopus]